ncbi:hypothetical protein D8S78_01050 [Natrialba swarupiae]|nr:hypothetical protein [Natrialba swarupiae]
MARRGRLIDPRNRCLREIDPCSPTTFVSSRDDPICSTFREPGHVTIPRELVGFLRSLCRPNEIRSDPRSTIKVSRRDLRHTRPIAPRDGE